MNHGKNGADFKRRGYSIARRKRVAQAIRESGQAATFSYAQQTGMFSPPAKQVDAETRALIDRALAERRG